MAFVKNNDLNKWLWDCVVADTQNNNTVSHWHEIYKPSSASDCWKASLHTCVSYENIYTT